MSGVFLHYRYCKSLPSAGAKIRVSVAPGTEHRRAAAMLTKKDRDAIRGMLADKQSAKTIAEQFEISVEEVEALKPPRAVCKRAEPNHPLASAAVSSCSRSHTHAALQALSAFMFFCKDYRDQVATELGSSAPNVVSKALGDKWGKTTDRRTWEKQAEQDRARFDKEIQAYNAALEKEDEELRKARDAAASGPSDREVERAQKRAKMEDDLARREAEPKKEKKQRVMSASEKALAQQNKDVLADSSAQAKKRLSFLLGQSDLFKHFGLKVASDPDPDPAPHLALYHR